MAKRSMTVAVPASVSTGAAVDVSDLTSIKLSITAVGTATLKVLVSYDGTNFVQYGANVTADADVALPDATKMVKVQCSAYTSGTPVGGLAGVYNV